MRIVYWKVGDTGICKTKCRIVDTFVGSGRCYECIYHVYCNYEGRRRLINNCDKFHNVVLCDIKVVK